MDLTGEKRKRLHDAVLMAVDDDQELGRLLRYGMNVSLRTVVPPGSLDDVVFALLDWLEAQGRLAEFIQIMRQERPHHAEMRMALDEVEGRQTPSPQLPPPVPPQGQIRQIIERIRSWFSSRTVRYFALPLVLLVVGGAVALYFYYPRRKGEQPNYIVQLYYSNPINPAVGAVVTMNDPLSATKLEELTDSEGQARFRLESGMLRQISIVIERNQSKRVAVFPVERIDSLPNSKPVDLNTIKDDSWKEFLSNRPREIEYASAKSETFDDYLKSVGGDSRTLGEPQFLRTHLPWGVPQAKLIISRRQYAAGFDPVRRIPRWTAYKIKISETQYRREIDNFLPDPLIPADEQASPEAYANNPYDRGHLISRLDVSGYGENPQSIVSYMSVVAPQINKLNQGIWADIEKYARTLSEADDIWIIAGPAFIPAPGDNKITYAVIGDNVAVPTHFFRIIIRENVDSTIETIAFLVPNTADVGRSMDQYLTSISKVESVTGLNFFTTLNEQDQKRLKFATPQLW
ncbi:MAG TPA: DNA/RNA non-specific endonuclease [Pyrinomonadaceae bacterium]|nr:DNA/RNA non-specific endonuclease [Pyrinomonadaceae bacterium]